MASIGGRDTAFDILKGISILEVVTHHTLGFSDDRFAIQGSFEWWGLVILQKIFHFAVPTFLLVSTLLLSRSIAQQGRPNWSRFYIRRLGRTVWPYLLWSSVYVFLRFWFKPGESAAVDLSIVGKVSAPLVLSDSAILSNYLFWGKAFYHLYFFSVLIQVSFAVPILVWIIRRAKLAFGWWLIGSLCLQVGIFQANYAYSIARGSDQGFLPFPASCALWYLPSVLIGIWLGIYWNEWENVWRRWRWVFGALAVVGLIFYLAMEIALLKGETVNSRVFNFSFICYTFGVALVLVAFSRWLADIRGVGSFFAAIGNRSLGLFVVHPAVLFFIEMRPILNVFNYTPLPYVWVWLIVIVVSWSFVEFAYIIRIGKLVFGRP